MPKPPHPSVGFQKGVSGNPSGRPKDPPGLKAIKTLTKQELVEIGNMVVKGDVAALRKIAKDESSSVIKVMVAAVAVKVIAKGDMHALDVLLNRLIGKVKEEVEHTGINAPQVVVYLPANGSESPDVVTQDKEVTTAKDDTDN